MCIFPVYFVSGFDNKMSLICRMCEREFFWNAKRMEGVVNPTVLLTHFLKISNLKKPQLNNLC